MNDYRKEMLDKPSLTPGYCVICGRSNPIEHHHTIIKGMGGVSKQNDKRIPRIDLCGFGNNLEDSDGRAYCHGLAHTGRLFFRYRDGWEYLLTDQPTGETDAYESEGWQPIIVHCD